jgi:hypothetical protein
MKPEEKIEYVKNIIDEVVKISPKGAVHIQLYDLTESEDGPVVISRNEQKTIIKKLEEDRYVKNVFFQDDGVGVWLEMVIKEKRKVVYETKKSKYSNKVKSIDALLADISLKNECLNFFNHFGDINDLEDYSYEYGIDDTEKQEIVYLLEDLGLISVSYDYEDSYVGPQEVTIKFNKKGISELFLDRIKGKNSIIKKQALEFIAQSLANSNTFTKLVEFLSDLGVQKSLLMPNTKWRMVNDVLNYYASCPLFKDQKMVFRIIEEASHPLMHNGDKDRAEETRKKFNDFLEYDHFSLDENGILWQGWNDGSGLTWTNKDGDNFDETLNSRIAIVFPEKMSELYVYWNELIKLTKLYFSNKEKQKEEINNLYFEIIGRVENLLDKAGCGGLKNKYQRPFRNMIGCEIEIENKGWTEADLFVTLYNFLGEITEISLPVREDIETTRVVNADFFKKIKKYIEENTLKKIDPKETNQEPKKQEPIPFMLVNDIGIKGLEDGLKALAQNNKREDGPKFPHRLPAGTKWENITIKFENDKKVFIKAKQFEHYTDFKDMGFIGRGNDPEPSEAWTFLRVLSMQKIVGELAINDKDVRNKYKKQKELLAKSLQDYFTLDYDPFYPYNSSTEKIGKSYKIKLTLIPQEPKAPEDEPDEKDDIKEYLAEQMPERYEEERN